MENNSVINELELGRVILLGKKWIVARMKCVSVTIIRVVRVVRTVR
jgi:hypothetical protein